MAIFKVHGSLEGQEVFVRYSKSYSDFQEPQRDLLGKGGLNKEQKYL